MAISKKLLIQKMGLKVNPRGLVLSETRMGKTKMASIEILTCQGIIDKNSPYYKDFKPIKIFEDYPTCTNGVFKIKVKTIDNNYFDDGEFNPDKIETIRHNVPGLPNVNL